MVKFPRNNINLDFRDVAHHPYNLMLKVFFSFVMQD